MTKEIGGNKKPLSQKDRILHWFKYHKKLDRLQALQHLGIFELSARIVELEQKGYIFNKKSKTKKNKYGHYNCVEYEKTEKGAYSND